MAVALQHSRDELIEAAAALAGHARGPMGAAALDAFYAHVATEDLIGKSPEHLAGMVSAQLDLAAQRPDARAQVRLRRPHDQDGWGGSRAVLQVVTDDMPFLVDSVAAAITGSGRVIHLVVHPVVVVRRDAVGALQSFVERGQAEDPEHPVEFGEVRESWMAFELDPVDEAGAAELEARVRAVLVDVREAVEDWPKMVRRASDLASQLDAAPTTGISPTESAQVCGFLRWLAANHFTFLGYREYALTAGPEGDQLIAVPGTGLGLLRADPPASSSALVLSPQASLRAHEARMLIITKANARSTVHRPVHLDYVSVKRFDDAGAVVGEFRFIGLFTGAAYTESVTKVPIISDKVAEVLRRSGFGETSHSGKDLLTILENYPRDELLQASAEHLFEVATAVLPLQERRTTKLFLRNDDFGRFVSCVIYLPRDHYNTTVRVRMADLLKSTFGGDQVDYTTRVSEHDLSRLHFVVRMPKGTPIPELTKEQQDQLEQRLIDAARPWDEKVHVAAAGEHPDPEAARLRVAYGKAFPTAYEQRFGMASTLADIAHLEAVGADESLTRVALYKGDSPAGTRRFKIFTRRSISLTSVLPRFTHMGVEVVDEQPYEINRSDGQRLHVYDFGLRVPDEQTWAALPHDQMRAHFESAFLAVWDGHAESDGFNALVLAAGLQWRQVVIVRMIAKYLRQTRATFSQEYLESALVSNIAITRLLVRLFESRFDPNAYADEERHERDSAAAGLANEIIAALDGVSSLDHDRIIRAFLTVMRATLRTSFYQVDAAGSAKAYVSMKLNPKAIPDLPAPRPQFEIWVYSPRVEGVHLRFGPVARGGLRWSDRREDFRTEILGLVKAQMVKNAVIVPTGSKGGFFAKELPDPSLDRQAWLDEGIASYRVFINGLLDITDNRVGEDIVAPRDVVRYDSDDPYLVVAADKGTATFSDIANGVAQEHGFWLDDAFASGGSAGYDHKAMGITARGAWESVKRHFREMGLDTQTTDFTAVGVGDMSGDVFGNGMLLSQHIRLVAAFDHRHIFVDPNPVAAQSFAERQRLFELPRSSWADYDESLISAGGGVWPRSLKSIPVSSQMRDALGLGPDVVTVTPAELMTAILLAPVDLLWNGGIGTYVKSAAESHGDVGDRANDAIRVDGKSLRCKVIGEGGNLGLSQLGRIEAAVAGVRVNTDAIDNSAGVDTSDHEVNIKILLGQVMRAQGLTVEQRNEVLASMTDDVAARVLRDNYEQNVLLGNARAQEHEMITVHQRLIQWLEEHADLDRSLEFLPSDSELARRHREGIGLKSPEFAVLVAYAKLALKESLLASELPDDPWFAQTLRGYFPQRINDSYAADIEAHPLRREIITNAVANSMVNRGGITFAFRAIEETGATPEQIARAFVAAREIFDLNAFVAEVEALDNTVSTAAQTALYLEFRRLLDRAARWFLSARGNRLEIAAEIEAIAPAVRTLAPRIPELLKGAEAQRLDRRAKDFAALGVPAPLAVRAAGLLDQYSILDIVEIAADAGESAEQVAQVYYFVSERFGIDEMLTAVTRLPREDQWDALARGAVRDDLYGVQESLTRAVIAASSANAAADAAARYQHWAQDHNESVHRAKRALTGISRLESPNLAALSVALRTLRTVAR